MTHLTSRTAVLLVTLVALLAGTAGAVIASVGTASAGVATALVSEHRGKAHKWEPTHKKVAKLADQKAKALVRSWAPTGQVGSAANAGALGGQPPAAYLTSAYTVPLQAVTTPVGTQTWTLPAVPAGTYQVTVSLTATMSSNAVNLYCALFQDGVSADLVTAYGVAYNQSTTASWRTVDATRTVAVSGQLRVQCRALAVSSANKINAVPANESYAPAQVSLVKVDTATALATAPSTN